MDLLIKKLKRLFKNQKKHPILLILFLLSQSYYPNPEIRQFSFDFRHQFPSLPGWECPALPPCQFASTSRPPALPPQCLRNLSVSFPFSVLQNPSIQQGCVSSSLTPSVFPFGHLFLVGSVLCKRWKKKRKRTEQSLREGLQSGTEYPVAVSCRVCEQTTWSWTSVLCI